MRFQRPATDEVIVMVLIASILLAICVPLLMNRGRGHGPGFQGATPEPPMVVDGHEYTCIQVSSGSKQCWRDGEPGALR